MSPVLRWLCLCVFLLPSLAAATDTPRGPLPDLIFENDFDSGDTRFWNAVDPPVLPGCNCYFSGDCPSGNFCNWGPSGPFTRDNCNFRLPKPGGQVGQGCNLDTPNPGPICDGICTPTGDGSPFASEKERLVVRAITYWSDALLRPAEQGGGPVDPVHAARAQALPFASPFAANLLGRHVADVLMLTANRGFYDAFCHFEHHMEDPAFYVDLSQDPCHVQAGWLAVRGVLSEFEGLGPGVDQIDQLKQICPQWQGMFTLRCAPGPDALECVKARLRDAAVYLKTLAVETKTGV